MKKRIFIIGGGASGMAAAFWAARAGGDVTIFEHMDRVGKKLLSTGNGRCNLTNGYMAGQCFRSDNPDFPMKVIKQFGFQDTIKWFSQMGLEVRDRQGYYYPVSDQASAVLDVLRMSLDELGVKVICGFSVTSVKKAADGTWQITGAYGKGESGQTGQKTIKGDCVILAAGSRAAPSTGSDGSGYELARSLGHRVIPPLPALVQLRCQGNYYKQLAGVRTDALLTLYAGDKEEARERGELQLTDYGLSGIPVFQISRYASKALDAQKRVVVKADFFPDRTLEETRRFLDSRKKRFPERACQDFFTGLLNKKLSLVLLKLSGIRPTEPCSAITKGQMDSLCRQLKGYQALVKSVNPFSNAQVCCGGVDTKEINPDTLESRIQKGLYIVGELLDVDGICGGYNLQWAWATGSLAGTAAAMGKEAGE